MTPREFFNAWIGFQDKREEVFHVMYYVAKYNASRTTMSRKQAEQIARDRPPWEKQKPQQVTGKQISAMLDLISKPQSKN